MTVRRAPGDIPTREVRRVVVPEERALLVQVEAKNKKLATNYARALGKVTKVTPVEGEPNRWLFKVTR